MTYSTVTYDDVEQRAPGMHFLRDALDCAELGVTVVDAEAGWTGTEHDHAHDDHEEVYLLLEGAGTLTVDGEEVSLETGDAVRVDPGVSRQLHFEEDGLLVVAGAP
jgi:quercetin dioxygenase-like cupin family protein